MKIIVQNSRGKELAQLDLPDGSSLKDLKDSFAKKSPFHVNRHRFSTDQNKPLLVDSDSLKSLGVEDGAVLKFKDLGPQIAWKTVFIIEYAGPLFLYLLFALRPSFLYSDASTPSTLVQKIALVCWIIHFAKREFETLFVHRFGNDTMPLGNLYKNCAYYWSFGLFIGYLVNRPHFGEGASLFWVLVGLAIFLLSEVGNGVTHLQLRNLRPAGSKTRRVPRGGLFNYVSCPNYTCEILAWVGFSIFTGSFGAWLFTLVGAGQMALWAQKKHARYRKEFPDYPRNRKALVPFFF
eukprot:TRINITY_DN4251_c0_g1_i1.p1 TRINITY_DN4251_c0_g1~~TRINITY_DN4251_c0_g1_i1.p1  ORF type:complete len:293 (+),score=59.43 TRINITY_DN4251_c0_g1_i1:70-948(+)